MPVQIPEEKNMRTFEETVKFRKRNKNRAERKRIKIQKRKQRK